MSVRTMPGFRRPFRRLRHIALLGAGSGALLIGGLALAMPRVALEASLQGLSVWWEVLFPALFPFFVLSEVLLGFGIVHLVGTLLDPLMRPLFRVPGVGGFVVAMGFASGYPVGAKLTSRLMEQRLLNREEGERLVAMTTSSDPIFLIGAVSIGFFGRADIAPVLAAAHYGGAMLVGLAMRRSGMRGGGALVPPLPATGGGPLRRIREALAAMHRARLADGRPFGVMLQQALQSSIALMIIVGGLVVFFSAALQLLIHSGLLAALRQGFMLALQAFGLPASLSDAFVQGTFEVTLGSRAAGNGLSGLALPPLIDRVAAAAFVMSWAGLSVHAQVAGLMSGTDWRYGPFVRARALHAVLAAALVYLLWPLLFHGPL
ncbi:nucleoside recognition domain-containing protein [Cohnella nanjingensis]|uniref:Sporulation integral membrane protein YlbJ n=1 Tax=Cohnella nanjingensis TaxID=1387779 RepID=A0A7X0RQZ7_9BACL|nr:nucleoside recognition domain-containing protein [Cohnella nanjingensis]MBB6670891.1 sporulation integral membrane protein YlbJ [Cohnella nanjingensis]